MGCGRVPGALGRGEPLQQVGPPRETRDGHMRRLAGMLAFCIFRTFQLVVSFSME